MYGRTSSAACDRAGDGAVNPLCCGWDPVVKRTDWSPGEQGEGSCSQLRALHRSSVKERWVDLFVFPKLD